MEPSILDEMVKLVFVIIGPIVAAALTTLLVRLFAKAGIELDLTKKAVIEQKLGDLVAQTEEWASIKIKQGIPITAGDKANKYLALVIDNVPGVNSDEATDVAKTILGRFRVAAAGSLVDLRQAAGK